MTIRLYAIRPEPGLSATIATAARMGLQVEGVPLSQVVPVDWIAPDASDFDALLLGSANAVRHAGPAPDRWAGRVAHVVGEATAEAARGAGLTIGSIGRGGLQQVVDALPQDVPLRLLRLAGETHRTLVAGKRIAIDTRVVYRLSYCAIPDELSASLRRGGTVLLHSGEAARHLAAECDRLEIARAGISLAALAPRIAAAGGAGWRNVAIASHPTDTALLAMVRDICHSAALDSVRTDAGGS